MLLTSKTDTANDLLTVAIQDLRAGADLLVERLPKIAENVTDSKLAATLEQVAADANAASCALIETGRGKGGSSNLWMDGILDDAKRDTKTVEQGALFDIALIGAARKGLAAAIVSYDTAIALAERTGETAVAATLGGLREADRKSNAALGRHLTRIAVQA